MEIRALWQERVKKAWEKRPILWLSGVRRAGKTTLCRSLPGIHYFDCELPSVRRELEDSEFFLEAHRGQRIVLDEIHRLANPSEVLKIAADHFPGTKILATGSSILGASAKFADTLTGRKAEIWLTPMNAHDLNEFGGDLRRRLLRGGLPSFFLALEFPQNEFQEWMDAYWAKDIQELFRLERRHSFQKFTELLFSQSGGIFEATRFAKPCEISRTTVANYLSVLEATYVVHIIRPFSDHRSTEITSAPKVYSFDTGFTSFYRGWNELRNEDLGLLWEHFVLNEIQSRLQTRNIHYWRDKQHREVDFIFLPRGGQPVAIECKWSSLGFNAGNLKAFRKLHPQGINFLVTQDIRGISTRKHENLDIIYTHLEGLIQELQKIPLASFTVPEPKSR